jgi:hypothetical protein
MQTTRAASAALQSLISVQAVAAAAKSIPATSELHTRLQQA